jgi:hypothetical protein
MLMWHQAGGKRHALDAAAAPRSGDEFRALCGADVTVQDSDDKQLGASWLHRTCRDCDSLWRQMEHIPQFVGAL